MKFFNSIIFLCYIFYFQVALSTYNVVPFLIPYDQVAIDILKEKVANTKWPDQLEDINDWSYGAPKDIIFEMASYFMSNFSWLEQSNKLNVILPQYSVQIGDHKLHFVHKLSSNSNAKPLIFIHGWPGSFMECLKIMPMLTEPQNYGGDAKNAFHVVCPSIPGYGFSTRPSKKGFDQQACAELFDVLMHDVLGYSQYVIQGGDWGSVVGSLQASLTTSKSRVLGLHINMIPTPPPFMKGLKAILSLVNSLIFQSWYYTDMERKALANMPKVLLYESGYFHEQSTRPQTLAYGITDSPVALMAWMFEKFYYWSDCHGDIFSRFTHDELLTNFMIYWITNTAGM
jgi:pimeloyl-ACP methyl ester carboxylesterase